MIRTGQDGDRRATVYRLFAQAVEISPDLRDRFLDTHCGDDAGLRAAITELLAIADADTGSAEIETGALTGAPVSHELPLTGRVFGRFRLREQIGEGGMGVVYLAERTDGVQQRVAVKLVSTLLAATAQQRFEREVQILARLENPSVARLIDAGVEDGRAWVAMEFVRGERIDEYCKSRDLSIPEIVRLLVQLSAAVAAAHALLVVHSDIKPANVLVTAEGLPKLIDFGIATALRDTDAKSAPTVAVGRLFSPNYAASEQVSGGTVTVATDVFGLGALGYRLLTGAPIYRDVESPVAYLMAVSSRDVDLPSRAAALSGRGEAASRTLRGDLDAILCKALEREPKRRYGSAVEFQADLQRYLDGRPVLARAPSVRYRTAKFMRRNALAVGLAGLLGASVVAGAVMVWAQSRSTALARDSAARRDEFLETLLKSANPQDGKRDITVAELLDTASRELDRKLGAEPLVEASMLGLLVDTNAELGRYADALKASERQLALLRRAGATPRELALATSAHGDVLSRANQYSEAESSLKASIEVLRREPGEGAALVHALGLLAGVYANTNRSGEAEAVEREAIQLDRLATGFPQDQLAVTLANEGRYAESADYAHQAVELQRKTMAPDNPTLLQTESTYAMTLGNLHRSEEALPLLQEVSKRTDQVLGPEHPDALVAQEHVGEALFDLGRYAESAIIQRRVAETLERTLGVEHRYTFATWSAYSRAACHTDEAPAGLAVAQRIFAMRAKKLEPTDWHLAAIQGAIGQCLAHLQRYAQAEPVLLKAASDLEAAHGPGFFNTQLAFISLRDMYASMGKPEQAAAYDAKIEKPR